MIEFSKVSIHNHLGGKGADRTLNDKYDKENNYDHTAAKKLIDDAEKNEFSLLALTQSNRLPSSDYSISKAYAKSKNITLLPGVEFNLRNEENRYLHTVVVFDEKVNIKDLEEKIDNYINVNKKNLLEIDQFLDLVIEHKCIIAAHGIKQKRKCRSASTNPDTFSELINLSDSIPVVIEDNHKYHKKTLKDELRDILTNAEMDWLDHAAIVSAADRLSFSDVKSPTYIWGQPTFDDLYYSCFMGETRIKRKSDILNKVNFIDKIVIDEYEGAQLKPLTLYCSHGLNTIIGPSGSGKTMLLDIIKRKLTGEGIINKSISKNCDYTEVYDLDKIHLFDRENNEITIESGYSIVEGEILYNKVISAYQSDKETLLEELDLIVDSDELTKLINQFNEELNLYIKNSIKIRENRKSIATDIASIDSINKFLEANKEASNDTFDYAKDEELSTRTKKLNTAIDSIGKDLTNLGLYFDEISKIAGKYKLNETFIDELSLVKVKLFNSIKIKLNEVNIEILDLNNLIAKQKLIYDSVVDFNSTIGTQYQVIVERKQELITKYNDIKNRLLENVKLIHLLNVPTLDEEMIKKSVKFKNQDIARLTFNNIKLVIEKELLKDTFPSNIGNKPKIKVSSFTSQILDLNDRSSIQEFAKVFIDCDYSQPVQLVYTSNQFIDYKIELKTLHGNFENIDSISAGNLSKIYINRMFEEKINSAGSNTIILYDQPDSNMEKAFILEELIPKISNLRNKNQVFITTHEPLLVVNSDSNNIISASNDKTAIKSNDITYMNKSFVGINSKKELVREVANLIDGHPDAVKKRSVVYGGILNENSN